MIGSAWAFAAVLAAGSPLKVPKAAAPIVIDAQLGPQEWTRAVVEPLPGGGTLRLQHDGRFLFLGLTAGSEGFPSLCAARGETVRVLHASAALGSVSYTRSGAEWTTADTEFVYGMRDASDSAEARKERRAYLDRHRWLATTFSMGGGRTYEMQISLDLLGEAPRLALGYYASAGQGSVVPWPEALAAARDGCVETKLVQGHVPKALRFDPAAWVALTLER